MPAKPIIAYSTSYKGVVHNRCLHPMQKAFREEMKAKDIHESRWAFPGVQAAWHPGHPSLPLKCAHCGKTVERGTEAT